MTPPIITVTTAAVTHDLTTLDTVRDELGIAADDTSSDARLARWISESSGFIRDYCGRVFAAETVSELWRPDCAMQCLITSRVPVSTITSITEDDVVLTTDEYEADLGNGFLYRLYSDVRCKWTASKIVIVYTGGYDLLDGVPYGVEMACIETIKHRESARNRDPMMRSQTIPGELEQVWWVPGAGEDGVPATIRALLDPHRRVSI